MKRFIEGVGRQRRAIRASLNQRVFVRYLQEAAYCAIKSYRAVKFGRLVEWAYVFEPSRAMRCREGQKGQLQSLTTSCAHRPIR